MEKLKIDFNKVLDWYLDPDTHVQAVKTLRCLRDYIDTTMTEYNDRHLVWIEITNREGNVITRIREEFKGDDYFSDMYFHYKSHEVYSHLVGTNLVVVDGKVWDAHPDIKTRLEKFDSFVGHHVETCTRKVPDETNPEVIQERKLYPGREITFQSDGYRHPNWFVEKEFVTHEWTDELRIIDRRNTYNDDYFVRGKTIELF